MKLSSAATKNALFVVLLLTVMATVLGFSNNLIRGYVSLRASFLYFGAAVLGWGVLVSALAKDEEFVIEKPLLAALGLEALALLVSIGVSSMPWVSFLGSMPRLMGALSYWSFILVGVGTVLVVSDSEARLIVLLRVLMIAAVVMSIHSLHELVGTRGFRAPGLLGNPDFLGNWLVSVFFTGFALTLYDRSKVGAGLAALGSAFALIGIIFAQTRGAWLGLAVGMVVFVALARPGEDDKRSVLLRSSYWFLTLLFLSAFALALFHLDWAKEGALGYLHKVKGKMPPDAAAASDAAYLAKFYATAKTMTLLSLLAGLPMAAWGLVSTSWAKWSKSIKLAALGAVALSAVASVVFLWAVPSGQAFRKKKLRLHFENEGRTIIWRDTATKMIPKVWYKGVGIETFRVGFLPYKSIDLAINGPRQNWRNPHDVILYELASNGILGLLAFLSVVVVAFWLLIKARRRSRGDPFELLVVGLTASLSAYLVHNLVNYDVVATGMTFYLNVGLAQVLALVALRRQDQQGPQAQEEAREEKAPDATEDAAGPADSGAVRTTKKTKTKSKTKKKGKTRAAKTGRALRSNSKSGSSGAGGRRSSTRGHAATWGLGSRATVAVGLMFALSIVSAAFGNNEGLGKWLLLGPVLFFGAVSLAVAGVFGDTDRPSNGLVVTVCSVFTVLWLSLTLPALSSDAFHDAVLRDPFKWLWAAILIGPLLSLVFVPGAWWASGRSGQGDEAEGDGGVRHQDRPLFSNGAVSVGLLVLLAVMALGAGRYAAGHLYADWHLHRTKGISKSVVPKLVAKGRQVMNQLRKLAALERSGRISADRASSVRANLLDVRTKVQVELHKLLVRVRSHGKRSVANYSMMGFFHHQYAKALQSFVKEPGLLPRDEERSVLEEAVSESEKGIENNTNPESANSNLAVLHYWSMRLCGRDAACRQERRNRSLEALNRSISYDRYYYDTHRMKAYILMQMGQLDEAVSEIRLALKIISYRRDKYPTVVQVERSIADKLLSRAYRAARSQKWQQAYDEAQQVINRFGDPMPAAYLVMGRAAYKMRRFEDAEAQYRRAIGQMKPAHFPDAELDLARLLAEKGRYDEGLGLLSPLLEPRVREPQALLVRAWIFEKQGKPHAALADYRLFLSLRPKWPTAAKIKAKIQKLSNR